MDKHSTILVTGASGMVGRATIRHLKNCGYTNLLTPSHSELDLTDQNKVLSYFKLNSPEYVLMIAAKVGGIGANIEDPVGFLDNNLRIIINIFHACHLFETTKILFLGSSCIYPRDAKQPMKEDYLLSGMLEPTNEGYALAKIVGIKLATFYYHQYGLNTICLMPCNIYGTGDNYDLDKAHVLSSLIKRFVDANFLGVDNVTLWGTGSARREFVHVDDVARSIIYFLKNIDYHSHINIGWGVDITIKELALLIRDKVGFSGSINWDSSKPDGMPRKCLDVHLQYNLGFKPEISLEEGIEKSIDEYVRFIRPKEV